MGISISLLACFACFQIDLDFIYINLDLDLDYPKPIQIFMKQFRKGNIICNKLNTLVSLDSFIIIACKSNISGLKVFKYEAVACTISNHVVHWATRSEASLVSLSSFIIITCRPANNSSPTGILDFCQDPTAKRGMIQIF